LDEKGKSKQYKNQKDVCMNNIFKKPWAGVPKKR